MSMKFRLGTESVIFKSWLICLSNALDTGRCSKLIQCLICDLNLTVYPPHIKNITALKITRVMPLYLLDAMWTLTVCIF